MSLMKFLLFSGWIVCLIACSGSDFSAANKEQKDNKSASDSPGADGEDQDNGTSTTDDTTGGSDEDDEFGEDEESTTGSGVSEGDSSSDDDLEFDEEEIAILLKCEPKITDVIPWDNRTNNGTNILFTAELSQEDIGKKWPNWTRIDIAADGAPNNASALTIANISFSNPANGTHPGDDTFLLVHRDGKWEKGVSFPGPYQAVETGEEDLPETFDFRASISKQVTVQDAKLNITYCENAP